jgi:hypothetical protein
MVADRRQRQVLRGRTPSSRQAVPRVRPAQGASRRCLRGRGSRTVSSQAEGTDYQTSLADLELGVNRELSSASLNGRGRGAMPYETIFPLSRRCDCAESLISTVTNRVIERRPGDSMVCARTSSLLFRDVVAERSWGLRQEELVFHCAGLTGETVDVTLDAGLRRRVKARVQWQSPYRHPAFGSSVVCWRRSTVRLALTEPRPVRRRSTAAPLSRGRAVRGAEARAATGLRLRPARPSRRPSEHVLRVRRQLRRPGQPALGEPPVPCGRGSWWREGSRRESARGSAVASSIRAGGDGAARRRGF